MVGGECAKAGRVSSEITVFAHYRTGPFEDGEIKQAKAAER